MTASAPERPATPGVRYEGTLIIHEDLEAKLRTQTPSPTPPPAAPAPAQPRSLAEEVVVVAVAIPAIVVGSVVAKTVVLPIIGATEVAKDAADGSRPAQAILIYFAAVVVLAGLIIAFPKLGMLFLFGMIVAFPIAFWLRMPR